MNFEMIMPALLTHEGGRVNNPKDPGGKTNNGVTQNVYNAWRRNRGLPAADVYNISHSEVIAIYREQYWNKIAGDRLPEGVNYVVFDGAVNSGCSQSVKWLQRALGVRVDGSLGEATIAAAVSHPNHDALVDAICEQRLRFMRALKTWKTFGKGWARRVNEVKTLGQQWATGQTENLMQPTYFAGGDTKAYLESAEAKPSRAVADAATGGGIFSGGLAGTLQQTQDALAPFTGSEIIQRIVIMLILIGAVVTLGGWLWGRYVRIRQKEHDEALGLTLATEGSVLA